MARKIRFNCLQVLGITGLSQTTSNVLSASGNSQELHEAAIADAVRFYLDITAVNGSGTIKFNLNEKDPCNYTFVTNNPAADVIFNATGLTGTTASTLISTVDPCLAMAYQVAWTITGFTSVTCQLIGEAILRS